MCGLQVRSKVGCARLQQTAVTTCSVLRCSAFAPVAVHAATRPPCEGLAVSMVSHL